MQDNKDLIFRKAKELVPIFESLAERGFEMVKNNKSEN